MTQILLISICWSFTRTFDISFGVKTPERRSTSIQQYKRRTLFRLLLFYKWKRTAEYVAKQLSRLFGGKGLVENHSVTLVLGLFKYITNIFIL
jgi:hypothetical protein